MSGTIGAIIAFYFVHGLFRRQQRTPARALADGQGYLLHHPTWERVLTALAFVAAAIPASLAAYVMWHPAVPKSPAAAPGVLWPCSGFLAALGAWSLLHVRNRIRVDDCGVTLYQGKSTIEIAWANVKAVTTDLTGALLICSATGSRIPVHKLFVGIPTLAGYMRRHLPRSMYSHAFSYYTPRAQLAAPAEDEVS
jgi:hypothetical protein